MFQNPIALHGKKARHLRVGSRIGHCVTRMRKDFNDHVMIARLDIVPHRKRMNDEALDEKFKDPDDPLRLVFLTEWVRGGR